MGNCSVKGMAEECEKPIRILTDSGTIINFHGAKQVDQILNHYPPGYGVFRWPTPSSPLPNTESLAAGKSYFLLPLPLNPGAEPTENGTELSPAKKSDASANLAAGSGLEVLPAGGDSVWRVKLVIDTKELERILADEVNTEALIERMRAAAASSAATGSPRRMKIGAWKPTLSNFLKLLPIGMGNSKGQIKDYNA